MLENRFIVGIDPGAHGAIALLDLHGRIQNIHDMPTIKVKVGKTNRERISVQGFIDLLRGVDVEIVVIEQVGGMTGQSASAAFTFGLGCGLIHGAISALNLPACFIPPQRWKKAAGLGPDKGSARLMAQQLWPDKAKQFARVKDDGRAEAALIARHYWRSVPTVRAA